MILSVRFVLVPREVFAFKMSGNPVNMLAAKKIKLHGMKSSKWTTMDKIHQYRGLVNLYTRDKKIIESDTNLNRKKAQKLLREFGRSVYVDRNNLDNAIRGDKQKLRNTLCEHKELQLAYQNSQPNIVIEEIDQRNFSRRKVLDKLIYEKKVKSQRLTDLNLELALLEDRLKYKVLGQIKEEEEAQIITGKVQDAILRRDAAGAINRIYKEILDIMKRDSLYFDSIIQTIKNDGYNQSKCFLGATKLGQIATEYLDDRRQEYTELEQVILRDMKRRKADIKGLNRQVENTTTSINQLLRKDSDIITCVVACKETASLRALHHDIKHVKITLNFLKNVTLVPSYDSIRPCLQEQVKQNARLRRLTKKCEKAKDVIQNKFNHAEVISAVLDTTMHDDILEYVAKKQTLLKTIDELTRKYSENKKSIQYHCEVAAKTRVALRQLQQISYNMRADPKKKTAGFTFPSPKSIDNLLHIPDIDEINGVEIIQNLIRCFSNLMAEYFSKHKKQEDLDDAYNQIETMMQARMKTVPSIEQKISQRSLLLGLYTEAPQELTREDIKKQSQIIVAANIKNDDLIPLYDAPSKKTWKKSKK